MHSILRSVLVFSQSLLLVLALPWSNDVIYYGTSAASTPQARDCFTAIAAIPSGNFISDPSRPGYNHQPRLIDVQFPSPNDRQVILVPAAFRSRTRAVLVHSTR